VRPFLLALLSASVLAAAPAAQRGAGPPPPTNLQVLPKDTSPQDVLALMQQFTQALGVQCTYCHVQPPVRLLTPEETAAAENQAQAQGRGRGRGRGQGPPPIDFASDEKPSKKVAREMLRMVNDLDARLATRLGKPSSSIVHIQCVTCHRGVTQPEQLSDLLARTMLTKGDGAATAMYRDLRHRYYGSQAYDFRESVLLRLAQQSLAVGKPDDAAAWLQLNVEFYPRSVASLVALAGVHVRQRDPAAAIRALERALEIDPEHAEARRQLAALKK
jgi:tetratricopeptide (TPR) repeat protein